MRWSPSLTGKIFLFQPAIHRLADMYDGEFLNDVFLLKNSFFFIWKLFVSMPINNIPMYFGMFVGASQV